MEIKNYTVLLMLEKSISKKIERLRIDLIGSPLVDNLLPHVSLKRRFILKPGIAEKEIVKIVKNFSLPIITATNFYLDYWPEVTIVKIENDNIINKHKELVHLLGDRIVTISPEYENDGFKIHLTLLRDPEHKFTITQDVISFDKMSFDTISLFEIGEPQKRNHAIKIYSRKLKEA